MIDARITTPTFKLVNDDSGEIYCVGSEVGNLLSLTRGDLYKKFPLLWRRQCSVAERRTLIDNSDSPPV
ncbi:MAG: SWI SNF, matrix associated, actin dependent regulator of chromatin, subfamily b, member 1 [Marteilia pararefringens]